MCESMDSAVERGSVRLLVLVGTFFRISSLYLPPLPAKGSAWTTHSKKLAVTALD